MCSNISSKVLILQMQCWLPNSGTKKYKKQKNKSLLKLKMIGKCLLCLFQEVRNSGVTKSSSVLYPAILGGYWFFDKHSKEKNWCANAESGGAASPPQWDPGVKPKKNLPNLHSE